MEILIRDTPEEVADTAANILEPYIEPGAVMGLATGSTPVATYQELIRRHTEEGLSFKGVTAFCLDEYIGISPDHEQSYYRFIRDEFTSHVDFDDAAVHSPNALAPHPWQEAKDYDQAIKDAGGIDVQVLGIGTNGHIGFNEPAAPLRGRTHVQILHPQTIRDNSRFFASEEEVPKYAITQGLGTILDSGHALIIATGAQKAWAVQQMIEGPITTSVPGSTIQLHDHATIIVDAAAGHLLKDHDYYRYRESMRPDWLDVSGRPIQR